MAHPAPKLLMAAAGGAPGLGVELDRPRRFRPRDELRPAPPHEPAPGAREGPLSATAAQLRGPDPGAQRESEG